MAAKTVIETAQEFAQEALSRTPVIVLGSGASAAHGVPGMAALGSRLKAIVAPSTWSTSEKVEWDKFYSQLDSGIDLESALGEVRLSDRQTAQVAETTRDFLLPSDMNVFAALLSDRRSLPLTRLYRHLFTSTHRTVDVITPNYDRLAEYAADAADFSCFTGFTNGHLQVRAKDANARVHHGNEATRTVCVWKVHGSLDWFEDSSHQIIGARSCRETPAGYSPLMITPGLDKYRLAHLEPFRTIFSCSDSALEKARSYLCIGYGFNDEHLQTKLVERCDAESVPIVVIAMELTPATKAFLNSGRVRSYVAMERCHGGTRVYTSDVPGGSDVLGEEHWRLDRFLDLTVGAAA